MIDIKATAFALKVVLVVWVVCTVFCDHKSLVNAVNIFWLDAVIFYLLFNGMPK